MGFYEYNSFGKFQAEADYSDALPANAELIAGYERALGEQHEILPILMFPLAKPLSWQFTKTATSSI